jgi:hypothetical protein
MWPDGDRPGQGRQRGVKKKGEKAAGTEPSDPCCESFASGV